MTGYWRNVTYLEKYVDHEMIEKVGFAKLECRKGNLRGNVKITDEKSRTAAWSAYIGHEADGTLFLRRLGELDKKGSSYVLTIDERSDNMEDRKLVLLGRNNEYCSDGSLENYKIQVEGQEVAAAESIEKPRPERKKEVPEAKVSEPAPMRNSEPESMAVPPQALVPEQAQPQQMQSAPVPETTIPPTMQAPSESNAGVECSDEWIDKVLKTSAGMYPFEDDDLNQCVRIEPKDFGLLPAKDWALGSNSFLLNGYYSYRHVLFGVKEDKGKRSCYLGVPGMYHRREIFMAKMFGFSMFKGVQAKKSAAIGDFGYWMMQIM